MATRVPATLFFTQGVQQTVTGLTAQTYYIISFFNFTNNEAQSVSYDIITDGGLVTTFSAYSDSVKIWLLTGVTSLKITVQTLDQTTFTSANPSATSSVIKASTLNVYATITQTN